MVRSLIRFSPPASAALTPLSEERISRSILKSPTAPFVTLQLKALGSAAPPGQRRTLAQHAALPDYTLQVNGLVRYGECERKCHLKVVPAPTCRCLVKLPRGRGADRRGFV